MLNGIKNKKKNKEEFFDNIKEKLSVKKINKRDKEIINKTYDNIYEIIKNNKLYLKINNE